MIRLTPKKVDEVFLDVLGEEGMPLIRAMRKKDNLSEFRLATLLKLDVKRVRNLLYKLSNHNLVGFTRKKDKEKGWYIYYWSLLTDQIKYQYVRSKKEQLARLKDRLDREGREHFFFCPQKCVTLDFDQATDFEFHCPECGEIVSLEAGKEHLPAIKKKIEDAGFSIEKSFYPAENPFHHFFVIKK